MAAEMGEPHAGEALLLLRSLMAKDLALGIEHKNVGGHAPGFGLEGCFPVEQEARGRSGVFVDDGEGFHKLKK